MVDFVYFAQRRSDGAIKIGCAYNVALRLKAIGRRGDRLDLLASTEGGRALEGRFHAFLLDHHVGHEWFAPASEVMRVIDAVRTGAFDFSTLPLGASPLRSASANRAWARRRARLSEAA